MANGDASQGQLDTQVWALVEARLQGAAVSRLLNGLTSAELLQRNSA